MRKTIRITAAIVSSIGLLGGLGSVVAAQTGTISTTGPDSANHISSKNSQKMKVQNTNNLGVSNVVSQTSATGNAKVKHNTTGGDAGSGSATNTSGVSASASIDNIGASSMMPLTMPSSSGSIDTTGPNSINTVKSKNTTEVNVTNSNTISVNNTVTQKANSGNASVSGNTTGGSATTGDASNTSSTVLSFSVSN